MEIKIELDLPSIIGAAVNAERIQPLLDKAIAEAIKDAIGAATGYRSKFRQALNEQLSEAMPQGLKIEDCAKFQQVLNRAITEAVHGENAQTMQAAMRAAAKAVISEVPARIKLSELVDEARNGFHKEKHEAFYARLEMSNYGGGALYLDGDKSCREKYKASIRIAFNKEGSVYAMRLNERDLPPKSMPDAIGKFDGLLLSMYVGRTSLELDQDEDDVESAAAEQDE